MLEKFVASIVTNYLGRYVSNIDKDSIRLSLWQGNALLTNLNLRTSAIDDLGLPITISRGHIRTVRLTIPWSRINVESIRIQIEGVYVLVVPIDATDFSQSDYEARQKEKKQNALQIFEALRQQKLASRPSETTLETETDAMETTADKGFMDRLRRSIVNNIEITVKNVHIVFEDAVTNKARCVRSSLSFDEFHTSTINPSTGEYAFVSATEAIITKCANLRNISVAMDVTDTTPLNMVSLLPKGTPEETWVSAMTAPLQHHILTPTTVNVCVEYQPQIVLLSAPKYRITAQVSGPCLCISRQQYDFIWGFWRYVVRHPNLERYRVFKPPIESKPLSHPRAWWHYGISCVLLEVRAAMRRRLSWAVISSRSKDKQRYIELFRRHQDVAWLDKLTEIEQAELSKLEDTLTLEDIMYFRNLAYERLRLEEDAHATQRSRIEKHAQVARQQETKSWSGWIRYYAGAGGGGAAVETEEEKSVWDLVDARVWNKKQRAVLYTSLGISTEDEVAEPKIVGDFVSTLFTLTVSEGSMHFVKYNGEAIAVLAYNDFMFYSESKLNSFTTRCTLGEYHLKDVCLNSVVLCPQTEAPVVNDGSDNDACDAIPEHLSLTIEKLGPTHFRVDMNLEPVELRLALSFLQALCGFWGVGSTSAFLGEVVKAQTSESAKQYAAQKYLELELKRKIERMWQVDLHANIQQLKVSLDDADVVMHVERIVITRLPHSGSPSEWCHQYRADLGRISLGSILSTPMEITIGKLMVPQNLAMPATSITIRAPLISLDLCKANMHRVRLMIGVMTEFINNMGGRGVMNLEQTKDDEMCFAKVRGPVLGYKASCLEACPEPTPQRIEFVERTISVYCSDRGTVVQTQLELSQGDFQVTPDDAAKALLVMLPQGGLKFSAEDHDNVDASMTLLTDHGIILSNTTSGLNFENIRLQVHHNKIESPSLLAAVDCIERAAAMVPMCWIRFEFEHPWQYHSTCNFLVRLRDGQHEENKSFTLRPDSMFQALDLTPNNYYLRFFLISPKVDILLDTESTDDSDRQILSLVDANIGFDLCKFDKMVSVVASSLEVHGLATRTEEKSQFQLVFSQFHPLSPKYDDALCEALTQVKLLIPVLDLTLGTPLVRSIESLWDILQIFKRPCENYSWVTVIPFATTLYEAEGESLRREFFALQLQILYPSVLKMHTETVPFVECNVQGGVISFTRRLSGEHVTTVRLQGCTMTETFYEQSNYRNVVKDAHEINIKYEVSPKKMRRYEGYKYTHYMTLLIRGGEVMYRQVFLWSLLEYFSSGVLTRLTYVSWRPAFDGKSYIGPIPYHTFSRTAPKLHAGRDLLKLDVQVRDCDVVIPPGPLSHWAFTGHIENMAVRNRLVRPSGEGSLRSDIEIELIGIDMVSHEHGQQYNVLNGADMEIALYTEFVNPKKEFAEKTLVLRAETLFVTLTTLGLTRLFNMITGCVMEKWIPHVEVPAPWPASFTCFHQKPAVCFYEWAFELHNIVINGISLEGKMSSTRLHNVIRSSQVVLSLKWWTDTFFDTNYAIYGLTVAHTSRSNEEDLVNMFDSEQIKMCSTIIEPSCSMNSAILANYSWHNKATRLGMSITLRNMRLKLFPVAPLLQVKDFWVTLDVRNAAAPMFGWQTPPPTETPVMAPTYHSLKEFHLEGLLFALGTSAEVVVLDTDIRQTYKAHEDIWKVRVKDIYLRDCMKDILLFSALPTPEVSNLLLMTYDTKKVEGEVHSFALTYSPEVIEAVKETLKASEFEKLKLFGMYGPDRTTYMRRQRNLDRIKDESTELPTKKEPAAVFLYSVVVYHPLLKIEISGVPGISGLCVDLGRISLRNEVDECDETNFEVVDLSIAGFCIGGYPRLPQQALLVTRLDASLQVVQCLDSIVPRPYSKRSIIARCGSICMDLSPHNYSLLLFGAAKYGKTNQSKERNNAEYDFSVVMRSSTSNQQEGKVDLLTQLLKQAQAAAENTEENAEALKLNDITAHVPELVIDVSLTSASAQPMRLAFTEFSFNLVQVDSGNLDMRVQLQQASLVEMPQRLFSTQAEPNQGMCVAYSLRPLRHEQQLSIDLASSRITLEPSAFAPLWNYLYCNYTAIMMPHLGDAEVLEIESDYTLTKNLVLSPDRVMRIRNTRQNSIKLFGGLHAIHFLNAHNNSNPLITLDEGVTLHIVQAQLFLYQSELTDFISCANGSYVVADETQNTFHRKKKDKTLGAMRTFSEGEKDGYLTSISRVVVEAKGSLTAQLPGGVECNGASILITFGVKGKYAWSAAQAQLLDESGAFELSNFTITTERGKTTESTFFLEPVTLVLTISGSIRDEFTRSVALRSTGDLSFKVRYSDIDLVLMAIRRLRRSLQGSEAKFAIRKDIAALEQQELHPNTAQQTTALLTEVFVTTCDFNVTHIGVQLLDDRSGTDLPLVFIQVDDIQTPNFLLSTLSHVMRCQMHIRAEYFNQETCAWQDLLLKTKIDIGMKREVPPAHGELTKRLLGVYKLGFQLDPGIHVQVSPMMMHVVRRLRNLTKLLQNEEVAGRVGGPVSQEFYMFSLYNDSGITLDIYIPQHGSITLQHHEISQFNFKRGFDLFELNTQTITLTIAGSRKIDVNIGQVGFQSFPIGNGKRFVCDVKLKDGRKRAVFRSSVTIYNQLHCSLFVVGVGEIGPEQEASVAFDALDAGRFEMRPMKPGYMFSTAMLGVPYYMLQYLTGTVFACLCTTKLVVDTPARAERDMYLEVSIQSDPTRPSDTLIVVSSLLTIVNKTGVKVHLQLYDKVVETQSANLGASLRGLWAKKTVTLRPYVRETLDVEEAYKVTEFEHSAELWLDLEFEQPSGMRLKRVPSMTPQPTLIRSSTQGGTAKPPGRSIPLCDDLGNMVVVNFEYVKGTNEIHLFCPYWVLNQTEHYIQISDDRGRSLCGGQQREEGIPPGGTPFLVQPTRYEDADTVNHALYVRIGKIRGGCLEFGNWSKTSIPIANVGDFGHIDSVMLESTGLCLSLGWSVEFASSLRQDLSYTKVIKFTPRWVVLNRTNRNLIIKQPNVGNHSETLLPGTNITLDTASTKVGTNKVQIKYSESGESSLMNFSKPFGIEQPSEQSINLKYQRTVHKPIVKPGAAVGHGGQQLFFDEDPSEGTTTSRSEFDVIRVTCYRRNSMLLVACDVIQRPPYRIENRTSFEVDVQQHDTQEILALQPKTSRGFVWEDSTKDPIMLLRVLVPGGDARGHELVMKEFNVTLGSGTPAQQFRLPQHFGGGTLYLRVRAHQLVTYISLTMDSLIDSLIALPFTNRQVHVRIEQLGVSVSGRHGNVSYVFLKEIAITHSQGGGAQHSTGRDMEQSFQFKIAHIQVDDERTEAMQPIVFVSHTTVAYENAKWPYCVDLTVVRHLDRTTPAMNLRSLQFSLSPLTVHLDDAFLHDLLQCVKELSRVDLRKKPTLTQIRSAQDRATPWEDELKTPPPAESSVIWQLISVEHFQIDCIVVFFSLYRRGFGANDPFRNRLGMLSAILRTVKDVRLVWGSVKKDHLSDKMWLLTTHFRDYYTIEFLKQFFQILNVPGLSSLRNMMTELIDHYPTTSQDGAATLHSYWELNVSVRPRRPRLAPQSGPSSLTQDNHGLLLNDSSVSRRQDALSRGEQATLVVLTPPSDNPKALKGTLMQVREGTVPLEHYVVTAYWEEVELLFNPRNARMNTKHNRFTAQRFFEVSDTLLVNYMRRFVCSDVHNAKEPKFYDRCKRCDRIEALKKLRWMHKGYPTVLPIPGLTGTEDITWNEFAHHTTWLEFKNALRAEPELFMEHVKAARDVVLQPSRNFWVLHRKEF